MTKWEFFSLYLLQEEYVKTPYPTILSVAVIFLIFGLAGCKKNDTSDASAQPPTAQTEAAQTDNLAPTGGTQPTSVNDQQQPAPTRRVSDNRDYANDGSYNDDSNYDNQDGSYGQPVLQAQEPPPELPEYSQPECPGDGYLWTPGYWSYAPRATTGYPALGRNRLKWATYGPPDIGEFTMAAIAITTAHGVNMSVTTVALTMDSAMAAPATRAGTGADGASTITAPSTM